MTTQSQGWIGSRKLLRQLRDVMKAGGNRQDQLDHIVGMIADDLVAEVCSLYVLRPGEILELYATKGLKPEAVHRTRLRIGEGIIGAIASHGRPLALADAQSHPNFAYRPETGEESFQSMLGVPLQSEGRVLGVIAVQNKLQRSYSDEEVEALETVAMVLAASFGADGLVGDGEGRLDGIESGLPARFSGIILNGGLAMGRALFHDRGIVIQQVVAEDINLELERLDDAMKCMLDDLDSMIQRHEITEGGESQEILETYRMFAEDRGWLDRLREAIRSGLTAEAAVQRVQNDTRQRMAKVRDPYIRERYADLEDLGNRLLQHLGGEQPSSTEDLPDDMILIARSLGPAELLDYDPNKLRGVILEEGSPTAHVSIVARAMNVPMLGRCQEILTKVRPQDHLILDGQTGQVLLRPRASVRDTFADAIAQSQARRAKYSHLRNEPAITQDDRRITLLCNAGLLVDVSQMDEAGGEGIGLYRTEVPFMVRDAFPDVKIQAELYSRALEMAKGRPVSFRTLDIGGDKTLPYWQMDHDENPIMGWRAIRIGLDRPAILRQQLRALVKAGAGRRLRIMFPMIAEMSEFVRARAIFERELERFLAEGGQEPEQIEVGVMLEVPALVWQLPLLLKEADFVSVGSNDLLQFLFASDRGNPRLSRRYDSLSPPVLNFFWDLAARAHEAKTPLSVCGEMASHPLDAMALIGCGITSLSMPAASIGEVKTMVRSLDFAAVRSFVEALRHLPDSSLRSRLKGFAKDHDVVI